MSRLALPSPVRGPRGEIAVALSDGAQRGFVLNGERPHAFLCPAQDASKLPSSRLAMIDWLSR